MANEPVQNPFPPGSPFSGATIGRVITDITEPTHLGASQIITPDSKDDTK